MNNKKRREKRKKDRISNMVMEMWNKYYRRDKKEVKEACLKYIDCLDNIISIEWVDLDKRKI